MNITMETRREAHEFVKPLKSTRQADIISAMGDDALTAREIALKMGFGEDMNKVRPRLTELVEKGRIKVDGIRCCPVTHKRVAVFKVEDTNG